MQSIATVPVSASPAVQPATRFRRVLTALALAAETVEELAGTLDAGEGWDAPAERWSGAKAAFRYDLDGISYNLSVARATVSGEAPDGSGCPAALPADLSDLPAYFRRRFEQMPGADVYLAVLQAAGGLAAAIDVALETTVGEAARAGLDETLREDMEDCLRASRRTLTLLSGDLNASLPGVVCVVADMLDGAEYDPLDAEQLALVQPDVCV